MDNSSSAEDGYLAVTKGHLMSCCLSSTEMHEQAIKINKEFGTNALCYRCRVVKLPEISMEPTADELERYDPIGIGWN